MYQAFGLSIHAPLSLPELDEAQGPCDVAVRFGSIELPAGVSTSGHECLYATDNEAYFFWEEAGLFLVRGGKEVVMDAPTDAASETLRRYLLGPVLAMVLHQRGYLVFHGSAVALGGKAVVFLGNSGHGKSTTAAALSARSHPLLADDIVAISRDSEGHAVVIPGFPELNLWPDVADIISAREFVLTRKERERTKRAYRAASSGLSGPVPLRCIYSLSISDRLSVETIQPGQGVIELFNHSFGPELLRFRMAPPVFQSCSELVLQVPVRQLHRTATLQHLPALAALVEHDTRLIERDASEAHDRPAPASDSTLP